MSMILDGSNGVTFNDASLQGAAASPYVLKNRIINGAMVIDQRNAGAAITPTASTYTLDRWSVILTQASKFSIQQNAGSVTPPIGFSNYLGITSSSAYSVLTNDTFLLAQNIEGFNTADLGFGTANAQTVTLSFRVRSSLTGTFGGALTNSAGTRSYPFSYTVSSANTWTTVSITIAGDTTGTWIGATNGVGLIVRFGLGSGATFSGTSGAWAAGNIVQPTGTVSVVGTNGATLYITGVQLEQNTSATPFERRLYGQELANCQRYYYKTTPLTGNQPAYSVVGSLSTTRSISMHPVPMPVTMRTSPTVGYNSVMITNAQTSVISSTVSSVTTYNTATASNYVTLDIAYSAGGAGNNIYALSANAAGSYLDFSAEL
jgi:hypothetical protein